MPVLLVCAGGCSTPRLSVGVFRVFLPSDPVRPSPLCSSYQPVLALAATPLTIVLSLPPPASRRFCHSFKQSYPFSADLYPPCRVGSSAYALWLASRPAIRFFARLPAIVWLLFCCFGLLLPPPAARVPVLGPPASSHFSDLMPPVAHPYSIVRLGGRWLLAPPETFSCSLLLFGCHVLLLLLFRLVF